MRRYNDGMDGLRFIVDYADAKRSGRTTEEAMDFVAELNSKTEKHMKEKGHVRRDSESAGKDVSE